MGRLIKGDRQIRLVDIDKARKEYSNLTDLTMSDTTLLLTLFGVLDNAPTVEAIPKDQYKADMVAMLEELQTEIEEVARCPYTECVGDDCPFQDCMIHKGRVVSLIQSKINSLKEA